MKFLTLRGLLRPHVKPQTITASPLKMVFHEAQLRTSLRGKNFILGLRGRLALRRFLFGCLFCGRCSRFCLHSGGAEGFFTALHALLVAFGTSNHVYNDAATVFTTGRTCSVILTQMPAFAGNKTRCGESMMTPAFA
jgi:hypothetical protein